MTKTQFKDALRNVWKNLVSYISIILIALLSIATYMGVSSASVNLKNAADRYYKDASFYDIEITSTLLLSDADIEAIRALDSVETVVPFCYVTAGCEKDGLKENVNITDCMDEVAVPTVTEGNAPKSENECMVEDRLAEEMGYKVGDSVRFFGNDGEKVSYLKNDEFVITGIFKSPLHIKPSVKDNSYVIVNSASFDNDKLKDCYMKAYVVLNDTGKLNYFSEKYEDRVKKAKEEIENLASERTSIRDAEIKDTYQSEIDKNEAKLADAKEKLEAADASLTDAEKEISEGNDKIEKSKEELAKMKKELADGKKLLDSGKVQLDEGKAKLDSGKATLDEKKALLDAGKSELDKYDREIAANEAKIAEAQALLNTKSAELEEGRKKIEAGGKQLTETFYEAENVKTGIRNSIKEEVDKIIQASGKEIQINWSSPKTSFDINTDRIQDFYITDSLKIDLLNDNLKVTVKNFLDSKGLGSYYNPEKLDPILDGLDSRIDGYRDKIRQWNTARQQYLDGVAQYNAGCAEYQKKLSEFNAAKAQVTAARQAWNEKKALYDYNLSLYNSALAQYQSGLNEYESYKRQWEAKNAEYQEGLKKYNTGKKTFDDYSLEYGKGLKKLEEYTELFNKNKEKYETGLADYEEGRKTLDSMKEQLANLGSCEWIISGIEANVGYKHMGMTVDSLQNLGNNFTVLFVLLAALIIYATISRIINEQHILVGTTKAFGFRAGEILAKYMFFGLTGLLVGLIAGIAISFPIQKFALSVFVKNYVLDKPAVSAVGYVVVIVVIVSLIITTAAVLIATSSLLKQPATDLLRASMPKGRKSSSKGVTNVLSLFQKLILRNALTDMLRVVVTVASVAGCCALVNIGFTIKYDFAKTESVEFDDRLNYDLNVVYNTSDTESSLEDVDKIYKDHNAEYADSMIFYSTFKTDEGSEIVEVVATDIETVQNFYKFTEPKKHKPLTLGKEGIYLKSGYADAYDIKIGDSIFLLSNRGVEKEVVVAGTYENYTGQKLYMDKEYYKSVFEEDPTINKCMVKCDPNEKEALAKDLENNAHVSSVESSDESKKDFTTYFDSLNALLILIIVVAILMAAIIISNLTFMYVDKKKAEIIVMQINGFSFKEVRTYLLNESLFTTIIGIIVGLLGGSFLASNIIESFEKPHLQLFKGINLKAWLMSTLVTVTFTLVINVLALKKVKKLKLTDKI